MEPPPSDANYELLWRVQSETEREATVRIPVGRATAWLLDVPRQGGWNYICSVN